MTERPTPARAYDQRVTLVLLAEDDAAIREPLARALRRQGYDVRVADNGPDALEGARGSDLVVLDLGLPGLDGLEVCRTLRAEGSPVPVLVLTARASEIDAVVGLDAGADDYVAKPFRTAELMARIRALLRRGQVGSEVLHGSGPLHRPGRPSALAGRSRGRALAAAVRPARLPGPAKGHRRQQGGADAPGLADDLDRLDQDGRHARVVAAPCPR